MNITTYFFTLLVPLAASAQAVRSKGDGNVNVGVNNAPVVVNNNFHSDRKTAQELKRLAGKDDPWQGVLYPGNGKTELGPCDRKTPADAPSWFHYYQPTKDDYGVKLGSSVAICSSLPCSLIEINGKTVLSMVKAGKSLGIKGEFRAADSDMAAVIDGSTWHANDREAWYLERPDVHSIKVMDRKNDEVLWVSLQNPHYALVRGTFRYPNGRVAVQLSDSILVQDDIHIQSCSINVGVPIKVSSGAGVGETTATKPH